MRTVDQPNETVRVQLLEHCNLSQGSQCHARADIRYAHLLHREHVSRDLVSSFIYPTMDPHADTRTLRLDTNTIYNYRWNIRMRLSQLSRLFIVLHRHYGLRNATIPI